MPIFQPGPYDARSYARVTRDRAIQYAKLVFLKLDGDLDRFCRSVTPEPPHLEVYSVDLWSIIILACAEIGSQLDALYRELTSDRANVTIKEYRSLEPQLQLADFRVMTPWLPDSIAPFDSFAANKAPDWWREYNLVKHQRVAEIERATLQNAIHAVAGLFVVLFRQYGDYLFPRRLSVIGAQYVPEPNLGTHFVLDDAPWFPDDPIAADAADRILAKLSIYQQINGDKPVDADAMIGELGITADVGRCALAILETQRMIRRDARDGLEVICLAKPTP